MKGICFIIIFIGFFFQAIPQNVDINILRAINVNGNEKLDPAFLFVTKSVAPLTLVIPAGMLTSYLIKKDSTLKKKTLLVCSSLIISAVISTTLKYAINRPRPFVKYPYLDKDAKAGSPSFPSGHTSDAFSLATSLSIAFPKWYVIAPSFLWASSVGYSRMALGVHYPSDVLAGAIIGSGSAYLSYRLNKWYFSRKAKRSLKN